MKSKKVERLSDLGLDDGRMCAHHALESYRLDREDPERMGLVELFNSMNASCFSCMVGYPVQGVSFMTPAQVENCAYQDGVNALPSFSVFLDSEGTVLVLAMLFHPVLRELDPIALHASMFHEMVSVGSRTIGGPLIDFDVAMEQWPRGREALAYALRTRRERARLYREYRTAHGIEIGLRGRAAEFLGSRMG